MTVRATKRTNEVQINVETGNNNFWQADARPGESRINNEIFWGHVFPHTRHQQLHNTAI